MTTTKASQKAVNKYIKNNYDRVNLTIQKGKKDEYRKVAKSKGISLNQFIIDCIEANISEDVKTNWNRK